MSTMKGMIVKLIRWREEFSVNIKDIDDQHKRLFEIGSKIYETTKLRDEYDHYDEIIAIIDELRDYTEYHFEYEEKLLKQNNYDQLEGQHFEHIFFIKKLEKILKKDVDSQQIETAEEITNFIIDWISNHILKSDMKYRDFLNQKGIC